MPLPGSGSPSRPIAWVLLSQAIWLPLLAIDLHDRWRAQHHSPAPASTAGLPAGPLPAAHAPEALPPEAPPTWSLPSTGQAPAAPGSAEQASAAAGAGPPLSLAQLRRALDAGPRSTASSQAGPAVASASLPLRPGRPDQAPIPASGLLLSSAGPGPLASSPRSGGWGAPPAAITAVRPAGATAAMATPTANPTATATATEGTRSAAASPPGPWQHPAHASAPSGQLPAAPLPLSRLFRGSQLLGGALGLEDLQEGPMAALALVERAQRGGSSDPLAPLPAPWREPLRQALLRLPNAPPRLATARLVTLPSRRVRQASELPLALQSDGSVDILEAPADPALLVEVERWSRRQPRPAPGSQAPALLRFQPLNEAASASSPAAPGAPAAAAGQRHNPRAPAGAAQRAGAPEALTGQRAPGPAASL